MVSGFFGVYRSLSVRDQTLWRRLGGVTDGSFLQIQTEAPEIRLLEKLAKDLPDDQFLHGPLPCIPVCFLCTY